MAERAEIRGASREGPGGSETLASFLPPYLVIAKRRGARCRPHPLMSAGGSGRRARALLAAVCAHFGVEQREWHVRRASGQPLWALRYATYLLCTELDLPGPRLALLLGKERTTVLHHYAVMAALAPCEPHARRLAAIRSMARAQEQATGAARQATEEEEQGHG